MLAINPCEIVQYYTRNVYEITNPSLLLIKYFSLKHQHINYYLREEKLLSSRRETIIFAKVIHYLREDSEFYLHVVGKTHYNFINHYNLFLSDNQNFVSRRSHESHEGCIAKGSQLSALPSVYHPDG